MAITVYSEEETFHLAIAYLSEQFPTRALGPKSFLGQQARALAQLVGAIQQAIKDADADGVPAYATVDGVIRSRCSSQALDNWAFVYGLPSNRGAGQYGRNDAQKAQGGVVLIKGTIGTPVPSGSQLTDPSGTVILSLTTVVTIGPGGTVPGNVAAVTSGSSGNLPAGTVLRWQAPPVGVAPTCILSAPLQGGLEPEDSVSLLTRLIQRLQSPPKGGTTVDIRSWAEQALDPNGNLIGVKRAYVYPHRNGLGSYDVVIDLGGIGAGRIPSAAQQVQVQAYVDSQRVVTDTARVLVPRVPTSEALRIWVTCTPRPRYRFDWQDGGVAQVIESATATTFVVNNGTGKPPDSLIQAIDGYKNGMVSQAPRLQVSIPLASILPLETQALAYATNTPLPGKYMLTVAPLPGGTVAPPMTQFFAGGPAVSLVSQNLLAYLSQVGPSRSSGYADELDAWEDQVTVGNLARAALDTVDADGTLVLLQSPSVGLGVGVRLAVGSGAFTGADYRLYDNLPAEGPPIPDSSQILVTGG